LRFRCDLVNLLHGATGFPAAEEFRLVLSFTLM
jgi:hypothetical protein